jgi:hypothetical protein
MTIARTRPSPLNNNPESSDRNGNIKPQPTMKLKRKTYQKQAKIVYLALTQPVPFKLVLCQVKDIEIIC